MFDTKLADNQVCPPVNFKDPFEIPFEFQAPIETQLKRLLNCIAGVRGGAEPAVAAVPLAPRPAPARLQRPARPLQVKHQAHTWY
jgi:hypothetical protein